VLHLSKLIASQLVKNRAYKTGSSESTRLTNKELFDLWNIPTPKENCVSSPFRPEELAITLGHLKPGKSLGLESIFPEFSLHSMPGQLSNLGFAISFPVCTNSKSLGSGE